MLCKDCAHKGVCTYKEDYEIFLKETLRDAFNMMPKSVICTSIAKHICQLKKLRNAI